MCPSCSCTFTAARDFKTSSSCPPSPGAGDALLEKGTWLHSHRFCTNTNLLLSSQDARACIGGSMHCPPVLTQKHTHLLLIIGASSSLPAAQTGRQNCGGCEQVKHLISKLFSGCLKTRKGVWSSSAVLVMVPCLLTLTAGSSSTQTLPVCLHTNHPPCVRADAFNQSQDPFYAAKCARLHPSSQRNLPLYLEQRRNSGVSTGRKQLFHYSLSQEQSTWGCTPGLLCPGNVLSAFLSLRYWFSALRGRNLPGKTRSPS